jgi:hypothetical protein
MRRWPLVFSICAFVLALTVNAAPKITFSASAVEISGLAPGARIVLFAVQQEPDSDHLKTRTFDEVLADDDHDGVIHYDVSTGVRPESLWAAAELAQDGSITSGSPTGELALQALPGSAMRSAQSIAITGDLLEFLYVRPGVGAWRQSVLDSGIKDLDGVPDGAATISFAQLSAIGDAPPTPDRFAQGDILVAINPVDLTGYSLGAGK